MRYALIDIDGTVAGVADLESPEQWSHPEGMSVVEAEGFYPDRQLMDYIYVDGQFVLDEDGIAYREAHSPLDPAAVIKAIFEAMPSLTTGIIDAMALKMIPYLPDYSSGTTYTVGTLVVKEGKVQRKTLTGWREVK